MNLTITRQLPVENKERMHRNKTINVMYPSLTHCEGGEVNESIK